MLFNKNLYLLLDDRKSLVFLGLFYKKEYFRFQEVCFLELIYYFLFRKCFSVLGNILYFGLKVAGFEDFMMVYFYRLKWIYEIL